MPLETEIDRGRIQICPTCEKPALATEQETQDGIMTFYCHAETVELVLLTHNKQPGLSVGWKECPPTTRPKDPERE